MDIPSSDQQQHFERDVDLERFRAQLNWLIENVPIQQGTRLMKRTNKSIVQQIKAQHPTYSISEALLSNLLSGKKYVVVTLQLAAYLAQVFGVENLDFFLDPDMERQRRMLREPMESLTQQVEAYEAIARQADELGVLAALRAMPIRERAAIEQLIRIRAEALNQQPNPPEPQKPPSAS